jgi:hypothetical protein
MLKSSRTRTTETTLLEEFQAWDPPALPLRVILRWFLWVATIQYTTLLAIWRVFS